MPIPTSFPILLVDDEPEIADLLQQAAKHDFPEARFEYVRHLADVLPYLDEPTHSPPRLILLDIDLGTQQTGIDLIAQLRRHPRSHMVPIVMLSANQSRDAVMASYQGGANAFTHKPYSYSEWRQYVQNLRAYWFDAVTTLMPPRNRS